MSSRIMSLAAVAWSGRARQGTLAGLLAVGLATGSRVAAEPGEAAASAATTAAAPVHRQVRLKKPARRRFSDEPAGGWAAPHVRRLADAGVLEGYPGGKMRGKRPLTRDEAAALVDRVIDYVQTHPNAMAPAPPPPEDLAAQVAQIKALAGRTQADVSGVRDDLEFHLKKERQEQGRKGKTTFFGTGEVSYTLTDSEANLSPTLRFPYDWDPTPESGVTGALGAGKGFFAVDFYKLGISSSFGPKYTLVGILGANPGGQANNNTANGFELPPPTFQGECLFVDVHDIFRHELDVKAGYFWLPWGREVQGLLRLNPNFNSNSLFYKDGFSQANNQTGVFFKTHNASRIQYGFGLTSGDKQFSLPGTLAPAHWGQFAWQRPAAGDNSRLGRYANVTGKYPRFDWDLDYFDNGGEPGFFNWESFNGGFTWGPNGRFTLKAEGGKTNVVESTGAPAEWVAWYATAVYKLFGDTDGAFRYDYATLGTGAATTRVTTERTIAIAHHLAEKQTLIADYCHPVSNPGFNPASPVLNPGRDIQDDLFRISYRLVF